LENKVNRSEVENQMDQAPGAEKESQDRFNRPRVNGVRTWSLGNWYY